MSRFGCGGLKLGKPLLGRDKIPDLFCRSARTLENYSVRRRPVLARLYLAITMAATVDETSADRTEPAQSPERSAGTHRLPPSRKEVVAADEQNWDVFARMSSQRKERYGKEKD